MVDFSVRVTHDSDSLDKATLHLSGEVDVAAREAVIAAGTRAFARCTTLTVDLSEVTFLDSTCLSALLVLMAEAEATQKRIKFHYPNPRIKRLFELAGVTDVFPESRP